MHDRALPQRAMMVSADLQPYQNGSDGLVSILMGPVGPNHTIFPSYDSPSYTSCCAAESHRMDTHTHTHTHKKRTYVVTGRK